MSSIKLKDDIGNWVTFGGAAKDDINWILVTSSTQIVPATGGYYSIGSTVNDQGYTFVILPAAPANGTIVGVQVLSNSTTTYAYIQASGTDTIDSQVTAVLARNSGQLIERVRYYNGRWFRFDGNYGYVPPPLVGPYLLTETSTSLPESLVTISLQSGSSNLDARTSIGSLEDMVLFPAVNFVVEPSSSPRETAPVINFTVDPLSNSRD